MVRRIGTNRRDRELKIYSLLWGGGSFILGVVLMMSDSGASFGQGVELWLAMHGVRPTFTSETITSGGLSHAPVLMSAVSMSLVVNAMKGVRDDSELLKFAGMSVAGYVVAGIASVSLSSAFPAVSGLLLLVSGGLGALWIGSTVLSSFNLPIIGLVGLGGIFLVGLMVMAGATAVLAIAVPLIKPAGIGALGAAVAVWINRNLDF